MTQSSLTVSSYSPSSLHMSLTLFTFSCCVQTEIGLLVNTVPLVKLCFWYMVALGRLMIYPHVWLNVCLHYFVFIKVKTTERRRELMSPRPELQLAEYHREVGRHTHPQNYICSITLTQQNQNIYFCLSFSS